MFARITRESGTTNPLLEVPRPRAQLPQPRFLTRASVEKMFLLLRHGTQCSDLQRSRDVAVVAVLLFAGLRRQEALNLLMGDVNLDRGTLLIRNGKGRYGGRDRTAYLGAQGRELLAAYLHDRQKAHRSHPEVFTSLRGDQPMPLVALRRLFRRISTGIGECVTPHMLRHTCATLLRERGVDTRLLMDVLGHRSTAMSARYSHIYDGEPLAAVEKLQLNV